MIHVRRVMETQQFVVVAAVMIALGLVRPASSFSFMGRARPVHNEAIVAAATTAERARSDVPQRQGGQEVLDARTRLSASGRPSMGVSSSVIENVAKGILNLALANPRQATVECRVSSSAMELVRGNLDEAKVDG